MKWRCENALQNGLILGLDECVMLHRHVCDVAGTKGQLEGAEPHGTEVVPRKVGTGIYDQSSGLIMVSPNLTKPFAYGPSSVHRSVSS